MWAIGHNFPFADFRPTKSGDIGNLPEFGQAVPYSAGDSGLHKPSFLQRSLLNGTAPLSNSGNYVRSVLIVIKQVKFGQNSPSVLKLALMEHGPATKNLSRLLEKTMWH